MALENPDPSVGEALAVVNREINRSDTIITSLLGLARPSKTVQIMVDVSAVLRETLDSIRPPAGILVDASLDESLPGVLSDPGQLAVVFGNLVRNAYDSMPSGGRLAVRSSIEGNWVVVTIADSGSGLSREVLDRLFEPFMTTKDNGTGLGLSVAKMLVESSGGKIEARSGEGKGSVFTVSLPAKA
jgi:signal transduction histidine kinase